jgi:hypothetical protein
MDAGGVISSLGTVRDDRLCILRRLDLTRSGFARDGRCRRRRLGRRLFHNVGQFVEDGIARQAQLAQDFAHGAHDLGQSFGADDNQRNREDENYFKKVQTSMTVRRRRRSIAMTSRRAQKFRASSSFPCQLIIIPDRGVNDA